MGVSFNLLNPEAPLILSGKDMTNSDLALHFKLALESAEYADSYEEAQFTYRPQLDESRDEELIDILPDYLIEEITFPRPHASKFYTRVIKSLTEGLES